MRGEVAAIRKHFPPWKIGPRRILAVLMLGLMPNASIANDSNSALAAGGIVPVQSSTIRMVSEVLTIAPDKIFVTYKFRNLSDKPQKVLVAFPFAKAFVGGDVEQTINWDRPEDIFKFKVKVDGRDVTPRYESRVSELVGNAMTAGANGQPRDKTTKFVSYQAVWEQDYAPHQEVTVVHEYVPIAGSSMEAPSRARLRSDYCMRHQPSDLGGYMARNVRYILMSAKTWAGPIGYFRLNIVPGNIGGRLVLPALCGFPLTPLKSYEFFFEARNYAPKRDIDLLFLTPMGN